MSASTLFGKVKGLIFGPAGAAGTSIVDKILDKIPDAGEKQRIAMEWEKQKADLEAKLLELENESLKLDMADLNNARNMQIAALQQEDLFSKRFIYYLAGGSVISCFIYIFLITFHEIPENNQRFADVVLGVMIGGVISTIFQFFFGSTKTSRENTAYMRMQLSQMTDEKKNPEKKAQDGNSK